MQVLQVVHQEDNLPVFRELSKLLSSKDNHLFVISVTLAYSLHLSFRPKCQKLHSTSNIIHYKFYCISYTCCMFSWPALTHYKCTAERGETVAVGCTKENLVWTTGKKFFPECGTALERVPRDTMSSLSLEISNLVSNLNWFLNKPGFEQGADLETSKSPYWIPIHFRISQLKLWTT